MAFWRSLLGLVSGAGRRQPGTQQGTPGSYSGPSASNVNIDTALQLSACWACAKLITEAISALPVNVYKKDLKTGIRELWPDHPLMPLLNGKMNRWQTRQEYFESITYQLVMLGNNYSAIQRNGKNNDGDIIGLIPLMSEQMQVRLEESGDLIYTYQDGITTKVFAAQTIWHNKLFGNGVIGLSPLGYARNAIGIGQAAENSVGKIYSHGAKSGGILMIDKVLKEDQRAAIKKNFLEMAEGTEDRLFVLEANMKYEKLSMTPTDIELLASRRFQIEDICRFFGVPSVLVNDTQSTTAWGTGVSQIVQGFYKFGLRPYLRRYQDSMRCNLLKPAERLTTEIEFDLSELLQPDFAERVKTGKEAVTGGLIPTNEWRKGEGLPPVKGGDTVFMQQQMTPIDKLESLNRGTVGTNDQPKNQ